jgi:TatD DNase family protein
VGRYFDTHCHLDFECFDENRHLLIAQCKGLGVDKFLLPATKLEGLMKLESLSKQYEGMYIAVGIHPFFVDQNSLKDIERLDDYLSVSSQVETLVALGEMGLDKYGTADYGLQTEVLSQQLLLASKYKLPIILHNRKSDRLLLDLVDKYGIRSGVVHGFSGSYETATEFIKRGFLIGLGGVVSWSNARKVRAMVSRLSVNEILFETDSPGMSPEWLKGQRNSPETVIRVCKLTSELLGMSEAIVAEIVYSNSCHLFGINCN